MLATADGASMAYNYYVDGKTRCGRTSMMQSTRGIWKACGRISTDVLCFCCALSYFGYDYSVYASYLDAKTTYIGLFCLYKLFFLRYD